MHDKVGIVPFYLFFNEQYTQFHEQYAQLDKYTINIPIDLGGGQYTIFRLVLTWHNCE